ncbi:hypothetical protein BCR41DRAFT_353730 [Lobosporangium transversale]|uniref:Ndc10 domain-containing protein n=1 Tax=Lobosporangium transversale TaxID=64571 RepID=A0A1Y2GM48_9FUNG|nr:hypothetical protein BCR41DRAFT_353730 [Lobosporangium transversale]ORZ15419.1 hypothetical protein BCR41DRAFT_353730 [Lobosporangium transversale]|eukprot:XP_021881167.1 hypothetical protein BCR41DRAFT_353730 [Lobosporangium transversale]
MENFYLPCLPSKFALGMAGFYNEPFFLARNSVIPPKALQLMIFPWIEDFFGKNNVWWRNECLREMDEVDPNIVPDISAASKPGTAVETNQLAGPSSNTILYSELDISTSGFLRLLVRCRRIILQDAASRLRYHDAVSNDQQSRILEDDIFRSPLFLEFQEEMNAVVVKGPEANISQKLTTMVPEIAEGLEEVWRSSNSNAPLIQQQLKELQRRLQ